MDSPSSGLFSVGDHLCSLCYILPSLIMRFVFSKLFYLLLAIGLIILSLSWGRPWLRWIAFGYDALLILLAIVDARRSKFPPTVRISREFGGRFAVGAENEVRVNVQNAGAHAISLAVKDEYPPGDEAVRFTRCKPESRSAKFCFADLWTHSAATRTI